MKEVRNQILKYLKDTSWDTELYHYWLSEDFLEVLQKLKEMSEEGKKFTPPMKIVFKWMKLCPFDKIKVVMLIDDWHSGINHQGIPFSQDMSKMAKDEFYPDIKICTRKDVKELLKPLVPEYRLYNYNLERWCKQGVLMMPLSPTCKVAGKPHYRLWDNFRNRVIEAINCSYKDIPWMLVEKGAWDYEDQIESKYTNLYTSYPKCSNENWYKDLNKVLTDRNQVPIEW